MLTMRHQPRPSPRPHEAMQRKKAEADHREKKPKFCINDHIDILIEILKRLDGPSLGVASSVCRLWCTIARSDSIWEHLCFRHVSSPPPSSLRTIVVALGGYKQLYMVCVRPVLSRLLHSDLVRSRVWTRDEVQLSLSLFCVDYYERRLLGDTSPSSLMFLCKPVNV
ncbi:hypothetical protein I3760_04G194900 [Carya illinoinensis]|uniref:F-box domain-containing protein n=2 Tax=Carya illinoinensis TaxID=32201 RepID=A0A922JWV0_CARIL|nr:F-box protein SNE-like [Carya illinoinensis]KAG2713846.1 hypothetical protein I3760_04G194900 [Carya illinoinensis]KAG6719287.1 hypothetical protein I3842_04G194600 [Carya illinoinensis]